MFNFFIIPRKPFISSSPSHQKIYYVLSILLYMLKSVNPNSTFVSRFKSLLAQYPNVDVAAMGFNLRRRFSSLLLDINSFRQNTFL